MKKGRDHHLDLLHTICSFTAKIIMISSSLTRLESLVELIKEHPVLSMIQNMSETKKSDRLLVEKLVASIENAKESEIPVINSEIFNVIEEMIDEDMEDYGSTEQMKKIFEDLDHLS